MDNSAAKPCKQKLHSEDRASPSCLTLEEQAAIPPKESPAGFPHWLRYATSLEEHGRTAGHKSAD